eukprot:jgi/Chrzof1/5792/Cz16g16020.t1
MPIASDDPRLDRCGFAKLVGDGVEYHIKKYEVMLGRRSKSTALDVVLGDNMNISRLHAAIKYNFEHKVWEVHALGKNGVTVNGNLHTPTSPPAILQSQDFVQVGDRSFFFLLPKGITKAAKRRRNATVTESGKAISEPGYVSDGNQQAYSEAAQAYSEPHQEDHDAGSIPAGYHEQEQYPASGSGRYSLSQQGAAQQLHNGHASTSGGYHTQQSNLPNHHVAGTSDGYDAQGLDDEYADYGAEEYDDYDEQADDPQYHGLQAGYPASNGVS